MCFHLPSADVEMEEWMGWREDEEELGVDSGVAGFTDERMVGGSGTGLNT